MNNSSDVQISTSLFQPPHIKASKLSKQWWWRRRGGGRLIGYMVIEETVRKKAYKSKHKICYFYVTITELQHYFLGLHISNYMLR